MVTVIKPGKSLKETFYYNENKLKSGLAVCLLAENYPREAALLSEADRLLMLQKMAALRPRVKVNSLHISLNFDPSENLSEDQLKAIARDYMEGIGFGNQPYLVYEHFDAAHPHIHVVTTNIQANGRPISLHHLGIRASEPSRKMIEQKYGLVRAEDQCKQQYRIQPVVLERAIYGCSQTKRAIGNVLQGVLESYKYTSLNELNAVLGLYNVRAERGAESSRIYKNRGLVYRLLDAKGELAGVPIKASSYYNKPGMKYLENWFQANMSSKIAFRARIKNEVDLALFAGGTDTVEALCTALKKKGIDLVLHVSPSGQTYGLSYVDHQTRCVFKGSELGKNYSAKAMLERLQSPVLVEYKSAVSQEITAVPTQDLTASGGVKEAVSLLHATTEQQSGTSGTALLELLFQPEESYEPNQFDLTRRRKKRRKKSHLKTQ